MADHHVVKTELKLDDHASSTLKHIKHGFEEVHEKVEEVSGEIGGMLKGGLAAGLGFGLAGGVVEIVKGIGEEVFHAASEMGAQEKSLRGVLMMIDDEGASLEELTGKAHELNEEFATFAISTGQSKEAIVSGFAEMAERTGMGADAVKDLAGEMAQAGRAVPGGIDALTTGFSNLSAGMIRAKNPVVQLIAATGTLHGTAKQVAKELQKMSPEKAMNLGIAAIEKMSGKMANVPLSMGEIVNSLKTVREELFESLGAPMLTALKEPLGELRGYFVDNREEIMHWAEEVGHGAGEYLKESFAYLKTHGDEIRDALHDGGEAIRTAAEALTVAAGHAKDVVGLSWKLADVVADAGTSAAVAIGGPSRAERIEGDAEESAKRGDVATTQMLTAALVAVDETEKERASHLNELARSSADFNRKSETLEERFNGLADATTTIVASPGKNIEHAARLVARQFELSEAQHDFAASNYAAHVVASNTAIFDAFNQAGEQFDRTAWEFVERISAFNPALAAALAVRYGREHGTGEREREPIKAPANYNFTGPINVTMDFKDKDPDRMLIEFKRQFSRSAMARTTAATGVPHTAF